MLQKLKLKVKAKRTRVATLLGTIVLIAACSNAVQPRAFAQTTTPNRNSVSGSSATPEPNASSTNQVNADVLQELERMRTRIEELGARLKQSSMVPTTSNAESSTHNALNQGLAGASAAAPLLQPGAGQSAEPAPTTKPTKAEPFAFADWTWMNGGKQSQYNRPPERRRIRGRGNPSGEK